MHLNKTTWLIIFSVLAVGLSSCNIGKSPGPTPDISAAFTQAAETAIAQFNGQLTQTALAAPPTPLPSPIQLPTFTPLPTFPVGGGSSPFGIPTLAGVFTPLASPLPPVATVSGPVCNNSQFMGETIPDGTKMKPGQDFTKVWHLKNIGTCKWDDGFALVFVAGDELDGYDITLKKSADFVDPGETTEFAIDMTAHLAEGTYSGCWKMRDDNGYYFGTFLCVSIEVVK